MGTELENKRSFVRSIAIISLVLNILVVVVLVYMKFNAGNKLDKAYGLLKSLGDSRIKYKVPFSDTLIIDTEFKVTQKVRVFVELQFKNTINISDIVPVDQMIDVPINIVVNKLIQVDTAILIKDKLTVFLDEKIPVDQKVTIPLKGKKGINIPLYTVIPLKQNISLDLGRIPFQTAIPVSIPISEKIPVNIKLNIPINMRVPLDVPVKSEAIITFPYTLPVHGKVPLKLIVPVDIPLSETALKTKFDSLANVIKSLLDF
jgi:hypothetical protein